jgi:metallophosphoesterase superfamily enzyme
MKLEFFCDGPALVIEETQRYLVVADLHFGIEADLAAHGLHFRSRSRDRLTRLLSVIDRADPDALILLGDVKHSIPALTRQEYYELPTILETLRCRIPLIVFPGNHDIGIELYLTASELQPKDGAIIDGIGYLHGHTYPASCLAGHLIVIGHHHPLVSLMDEVGCALQSPAYLRAELDRDGLFTKSDPKSDLSTRALFVPSFNEIAGYDIFQITRNPMSPFSRFIRREKAEIILADGTYLGPLQFLDKNESN